MVLLGMKLTFIIHQSFSLKDKRSIVKSMIHKLRHKYNITIAEIDALDMLNQGIIGIGIVGNSRKLCEQILDRVLKDIEAGYDVDIYDIEYIEA